LEELATASKLKMTKSEWKEAEYEKKKAKI
jgi:hypothetical protein